MEALFVSRATADAAVAREVGRILEAGGYEVILPPDQFGPARFITDQQAALERADRVVVLLSPDYLADDFCAAEWQSVLAHDPLNRRSRLVVLRIAPCSPTGVLAGLVAWDMVGVSDPATFAATVLEAVHTQRPRLEAGAAAAAAGRPCPRRAGANNFPAQPSPFIGRERQLAEIGALLDAQRLVTLLGAGGIGKTRTALAVGARAAAAREDGAWFVDFAPLGDGANVVTEIAAVLGITEERDVPPSETLLAQLKTRRLLLILDNCEHVIASAREIVDALVHGCAGVSILATSRELLSVRGEVIYRLPTLDVPADGEHLAPQQALEYDAVALFVARAQSAGARFALTAGNAATVATICRRLDGIALAIELAAARTAALGVAQIEARLDERFRLLTGGTRTALPRRQTLRALIDWSYELLDDDGQRLFRRLAIFSGGWTLEAATTVCGDADDDEFSVLDRLTSLADKSLVVVDFAGESRRFRLLESMRAYALERARDDDDLDELARRRAAFFAALVGDGSNIGADVVARVAALGAELENLRDALHWSLEAGHDPPLGARIACGLGRFWAMRFPREGLRWLELAHKRIDPAADPELAADIAIATAAMLPHGSFERFAATERALRLNREVGDPARLTKALAAYGEQLSPQGRDVEAAAAFDEALACARRIGSEWDAGRALAGRTMVAVDREDTGAAREFGNAAIAAFTEIGAIDGVAYVCIALAEAEFLAGDARRAAELAQRARESYGQLQNHRSAAGAANYLAALALFVDDPRAAREHARDSLELLGTDFHPLFSSQSIGLLAQVATVNGDARSGALLFGYYEAALRRVTHELTGCAKRCRDRHRQLLTATLGAARCAELTAAGAELADLAARTKALAV